MNNLLSYKHSLLLGEKEVFNAIFEIISMAQIQIAKMKEQVSYRKRDSKEEKLDKKTERGIKDILIEVETTLHLFMYITEEGKISSDLSKLENIMSKKSALDDRFKDIDSHLEKLNEKSNQSVFSQNKE